MKSLNSVLFLILLLIVGNASAQNHKDQVYGEYAVNNITHPAPKPDTTKSYGRVRMVEPLVFIEFNYMRTLNLKWNKRFTITNSRPITTYGLNIDNATIHESHKIKSDALILTYRHNTKHFN